MIGDVTQTTTRGQRAARLADQVVAARAQGRPISETLRELRRMCDEAGIEHTVLLEDARRRSVKSSGLRTHQ